MRIRKGFSARFVRYWFTCLGLGVVAIMAFLLGFGSLAVEHELQKSFRSFIADMPVARYGEPELHFFPPGLRLERVILCGPRGELAVQNVHLDVKLFEVAFAIRGKVAGGDVEVAFHPEDWGRGAWKIFWKASEVSLETLLSPWIEMEVPVAVLGGRVELEGQCTVPARRDILRPWMGTGRLQCTLHNGTIRHAFPVLTQMELKAVEGLCSADWNRRRVTLRKAVLKNKDASVALQGGLELKPELWRRTKFSLEAEIKAGDGLLNEKFLPEALRQQQARGGIRLRLSGSPEKPKVDF